MLEDEQRKAEERLSERKKRHGIRLSFWLEKRAVQNLWKLEDGLRKAEGHLLERKKRDGIRQMS